MAFIGFYKFLILSLVFVRFYNVLSDSIGLYMIDDGFHMISSGCRNFYMVFI